MAEATSEGRLQPLEPGSYRLCAPYAPARIFATASNYYEHAREMGTKLAERSESSPYVFMKAETSVADPGAAVVKPREVQRLDWEVELGVVIGTTARNVSKAQALEHVAGYCVVNDVSEREFQLERGGTWDKGKGCDTFCPVGPWLVTRDEVPDAQKLGMWLDVNGDRMQKGSTATMVFDVATVVSYVSRFMTLEPGDLIATGTPPGVGMGFKPPRFLKAGDVMRLGIDGLGEQSQSVVAYGER